MSRAQVLSNRLLLYHVLDEKLKKMELNKMTSNVENDESQTNSLPDTNTGIGESNKKRVVEPILDLDFLRNPNLCTTLEIQQQIMNILSDQPESGDLTSNTLPDSNFENISKRARKRLLKKEKWLERKPFKRMKEKQKLKEKRKLAREQNIKLGPSRKELKHHKMALSSCKTRVALDFSFDHLMTDKDIHKCINQLNHCYSINRRSPNPLQFYVTNFNGKCKDVMSKHNGYTNWDVNFHSEDYLNVFKKEELVYLTSDSENVVNTLDDDKVYIIGALVDHNSQKGLTLKIAIEQGIGHARLPIDKFIEMKTRQVLSIDHVFQILHCVGSDKKTWKDAFLDVIPQRKGIVPKVKEDSESSVNNIEPDNT